MKSILLFGFACLLLAGNCFAKIWRVNNNVGINADFTTLQAAHNGAASGDTIYLESSATSYGSLVCSKKLIIVGTGYFLPWNADLQAFTVSSLVDGINFNAGSAGSVLEGVSNGSNGITISVNNITIRRNWLGTISGNHPGDYFTGSVQLSNSASNIVITQNYALCITSSGTCTNLLITNNFLAFSGYFGDGTANSCLSLSPSSVAIIKNNIFRRGQVSINNCNITNNIMYTGLLSGTDNLMANNIGSGTQFGTLNGNQSNVNMATVFEAIYPYDRQFILKAGSPAIGAGYGSTLQTPIDAGMYGGTNPYKIAGIPSIPTIYFFASQPIGSNSDPIDVQVKVRSNN